MICMVVVVVLIDYISAILSFFKIFYLLNQHPVRCIGWQRFLIRLMGKYPRMLISDEH